MCLTTALNHRLPWPSNRSTQHITQHMELDEQSLRFMPAAVATADQGYITPLPT
jgi:hypothetical protein